MSEPVEKSPAEAAGPAKKMKWNVVQSPDKVLDILTIDPAREQSFVAGSGFAIRLFNWEDGKVTVTYAGHKGPVTCILVHGDYLYSGSWDKMVFKWEIKTGKVVGKFGGHTDFVKCMCLTQDNKYLLTGSVDSTIRKWNMETLKCVDILRGERPGALLQRAVECIVLNDQNPEQLISCSSDRKVHFWDLKSGNIVKELIGHETSVWKVACRNNLLFSGSADKTIKMWDIQDIFEQDDPEPIRVFEDDDWVRGIKLGKKHIYTAGRNKLVKKWNIETGECEHQYKGHFDEISCLEIFENENLLITGSLDFTVRKFKIDGTDEPEVPIPTSVPEGDDEDDDIFGEDPEVTRLQHQRLRAMLEHDLKNMRAKAKKDCC